MGELNFFGNWIWLPDWEEKRKDYLNRPVLADFKKTFQTADKIRVSANCRYKLYINETFVQEGPQKGTKEEAFVDTAALTPYLKGGENEIRIRVLYYPEDSAKRNDSLYYSPYPGLYVEDCSETGELNGSDGYDCRIVSNVRIVGEHFNPAPIQGMEMVRGEKDEGDWLDAQPYSILETNQPVAPFALTDRTIPPMAHEPRRFSDVVCVRKSEKGEVAAGAWRSLLQKGEPLSVPAKSREIVELTAGEEMCVYPTLSLIGGAGSMVRIIYSESYGVPQPDEETPFGSRPVPPEKKNRMDYQNGMLTGTEDHYTVGGFGTEEAPECYTPYLFRTFRFVRIEITTDQEELRIADYDYLSTGYPLEVKYRPQTENEEYRRIWEISLRTLKRCMHETYMDCPFYEQLQYTMDSRAEMLFTYEVARDDRLARAAMESFRKSQRPDGILKASAPTEGVNVIPGFSIFYILMLHDHMKYFKDQSWIRRHFQCMDGILRFFSDHLNEKGLVKNVGGVLFQHRYWSFIDWCDEWEIGVPTAVREGEGEITMESLLYLQGLLAAAELSDFVGRAGVAGEYRERAKRLSDAIRTHCTDENGMLTDGPGLSLYSTHCQAWGILTGILNAESGKRNLKKTYRVPGIPQCSVSMSFYLMEAMQKIGVLGEYDDVWDPWRKMLANNMTTCVENFTDQRSDCHAWGAIMLYALPRYYGAPNALFSDAP